MAENVFAVSIRRGVEVREIDGAQVVSCGPAVANVDLKEVDGEIWVRSPASLNAYMGGSDIRDADGFYPTGDLGSIIGGELFITGRKQDLLIQAGRKYMLSDVDLALNRLFPWIKGRAAAVQMYDARLGTQKPLVLIEAEDFFLRSDQGEIAAALKDAIGLDQVDVEFVPPALPDQDLFRQVQPQEIGGRLGSRAAAARKPRRRCRSAGGSARILRKCGLGQAVEKILDSLSLEVLRINLAGTTATYDGKLTLVRDRAGSRQDANAFRRRGAGDDPHRLARRPRELRQADRSRHRQAFQEAAPPGHVRGTSACPLRPSSSRT